MPAQLDSSHMVIGRTVSARPLGPRGPRIIWLDPLWADRLLFDAAAPSWNRLEECGQASLLKRGHQRNVWRVDLSQDARVIAKVFDDPAYSLVAACKRTVGWHQGQREFKALRRLLKRAIPAVKPIALMHFKSQPNPVGKRPAARSKGGARMVLVTELLPNSENLLDAWNRRDLKGPGSGVKSRELVFAAGRLWAIAHSRGYAHPDGHPANVLIQSSSDEKRDPVRAFFVDPALAPRSALSGPVSVRHALHSLAMLDQYFHRAATRSQRLRFWRQYWLARNVNMDRARERDWLQMLAQEKQIHGLSLARQRDRRLRESGKYFHQIRLPHGWRGTVTLALARRHVYEEADVPDRTIEQWMNICGRIVSSNQPASSVEGVRIISRPRSSQGYWARQTFEHAHRLRHRDVPAPLVLGYLQKGNGRGEHHEFLILPVTGIPEPSPQPSPKGRGG